MGLHVSVMASDGKMLHEIWFISHHYISYLPAPCSGPTLTSQKPSPEHSGGRRRATFSTTRFPRISANGDNGIKKLLLNQMIRAKRAGTWFGLPKLQRGLYGLAMRLEVKLQSHELLKALVSILKALRETCDKTGVAFVKATGLAWVISEAAERWGNPTAHGWRNDLNYIRFLSVAWGPP
jgi:hypothetical protein